MSDVFVIVTETRCVKLKYFEDIHMYEGVNLTLKFLYFPSHHLSTHVKSFQRFSDFEFH